MHVQCLIWRGGAVRVCVEDMCHVQAGSGKEKKKRDSPSPSVQLTLLPAHTAALSQPIHFRGPADVYLVSGTDCGLTLALCLVHRTADQPGERAGRSLRMRGDSETFLSQS